MKYRISIKPQSIPSIKEGKYIFQSKNIFYDIDAKDDFDAEDKADVLAEGFNGKVEKIIELYTDNYPF